MTSPAILSLARAIASNDTASITRSLRASPALATARFEEGATRQSAKPYWLEAITHVYAGDSALHVAAAAHRAPLARRLIRMGADVHARNRRGATPLHYAVDGVPGSPAWRPHAQAATIAVLLAAGADPDVLDDDGVAPLHRAVRTRCSAAVHALLEGGADPTLPNARGSTALSLATKTTGRGGSGSPEAKAEQRLILALLARFHAAS